MTKQALSTITILGLALHAVSHAADKPLDELTEAEQKFADAMSAYRDHAVETLEERIKQFPRRPRNQHEIRNRRETAIRLRQARDADYLIPYLFPGQMKKGEIGYLLGGQYQDEGPVFFEVQQVVDEQTMLVKPYGGYMHPITGEWYNHPCEASVYVYGMSTEGIRDDQHIKLTQVWQCMGTKTYATVLGGSRTVFSVEPYPVDDPEALIKKLKRRRREAVGQ